MFGYLLDEPVVNLDGLINNEILDYELQGKQWLSYAVDKLEIDYGVNVFKQEWLPPPFFKEHFIPCYISEDYGKDNIGFRIYGRKTALESGVRDKLEVGCVEGMISSWWAGKKMSGDNSLHPNYEHSPLQTTDCKIPLQSDKNPTLVFGSTATLPADTYEVDYFLSVDDNGDDTAIANLAIANHDDKPFTELSNKGDDFLKYSENSSGLQFLSGCPRTWTTFNSGSSILVSQVYAYRESAYWDGKEISNPTVRNPGSEERLTGF